MTATRTTPLRRGARRLGDVRARARRAAAAARATSLGVIVIYRQEVRAVHRQADRAAAELRRAGGDRDGERAADDRNARGAGAADRDRRGAGGHQCLARRSAAGVRRDAGKGDAPVRSRYGAILYHSTASASCRCQPWRSTPAFVEFRRRDPMPAGPSPTLPAGSCAAMTGRPCTVDRAAIRDVYRERQSARRAMVDLGGSRTVRCRSRCARTVRCSA